MLGGVDDFMTRDQVSPDVQRAHKGEIFRRRGRGFSLGELKKAGIETVQAREMSLMVDPRRKSVYDFNVDILSKYAIEIRGTMSRKNVVATAGPESTVDDDEAEVETVEAAR